LFDIFKIRFILFATLFAFLPELAGAKDFRADITASPDSMVTATADSLAVAQDSIVTATADSLVAVQDSITTVAPDSAKNVVHDKISAAERAHSDSLARGLTGNASSENDSIVIKRGKKKEEKEKPDTLVTYFFPDTLRYNQVIMWTINRYLNEPRLVEPDTLQDMNRTELPFHQADVGATYLGTTGSATQLHDFFKRQRSEVFTFFDPYGVYGFTPDNVQFYNTKKPFSNLSYYNSGSRRNSEDNLRVIFARNISPSWNTGIYYRRMGTRGIYQYQTTGVKTFNFVTSYVGKKYAAHAGYIYNSVNNRENGGVVNDFFIADTTVNANTIDVRLRGATNRLASNTFFLTHSYGIPLNLFKRDSLMRSDTLGAAGESTTVYFGHTFEYSTYKRNYTDGVSDTSYIDYYGAPNAYQHYYRNYYISRAQSSDSSYAARLDNRVFIRLQPYSPTAIISKIDGGLGYSFENYYTYSPTSFIYGQQSEKLSTAYVYGNAQGMFSKYFSWQAFMIYHFLGYRINDLLLDANARLSIYPVSEGIHFEGRFVLDNREQPYFLKHYHSNHFRWDNDFGKTTETRIVAAVKLPTWNLEAGFRNSLITNYVFFNDEALPVQASDVLNVTSIYANSKLQWKLLRLNTRLLFQTSSNSAELPLPMLSTNLTLYIESQWVRNVLNAQIGLDAYYNTAFYDYAYNPATGMFHTQSERKLGNYPWIDGFASFKWKNANIYVKYTNLGIGIVGRQYFSALHYPRTNSMLRIGINWYFHN
jgi:hypothetical protein